MHRRLKDQMLPWARFVKYGMLYRYHRFLAGWKPTNDESALPVIAYVIGCGRSGTSILGQMLSLHPGVSYLFEPIYAWVSVDPRLDVNHFFVESDARMICDGEMVSSAAQVRFRRIFGRYGGEDYRLLVEKTPHNAMRIGYLERMTAGARYIHIVRDGLQVVDSISRLARENTYRVARKGSHNQWWGRDCNKWSCLKADGKRHGYFPDEVETIEDGRQMAAYEWLVSLGEVDRWKQALGNRLLVITLPDLMAYTEHTMRRVAAYLELDGNRDWDAAAGLIRPSSLREDRQLFLPEKMCIAFNAYQKRFGFTGRAKEAGHVGR